MGLLELLYQITNKLKSTLTPSQVVCVMWTFIITKSLRGISPFLVCLSSCPSLPHRVYAAMHLKLITLKKKQNKKQKPKKSHLILINSLQMHSMTHGNDTGSICSCFFTSWWVTKKAYSSRFKQITWKRRRQTSRSCCDTLRRVKPPMESLTQAEAVLKSSSLTLPACREAHKQPLWVCGAIRREKNVWNSFLPTTLTQSSNALLLRGH